MNSLADNWILKKHRNKHFFCDEVYDEDNVDNDWMIDREEKHFLCDEF